MNRKKNLGLTIIASVLAAVVRVPSAADELSATVARIEGEAVASKGAEYITANEGMVLRTGQRIMALAQSSAVLQFSDGCRYKIEANELLIVERESPCALGLVAEGTVAAGAIPTQQMLPAFLAAGTAGLVLLDDNDSRRRPAAADCPPASVAVAGECRITDVRPPISQ